MKKAEKTLKPFALKFLEVVPDDVIAGKKGGDVITMALTMPTKGRHYDQV